MVNPGRLVKGNSAGTYAKLVVFPMPGSRLEQGASHNCNDSAVRGIVHTANL